MKNKKSFIKLVFFVFFWFISDITAGEVKDYKYLNKPIPIINGEDVDDVTINLLKPETLLPLTLREGFAALPPPEKEKFLQNFVFVFIFFEFDKNKRILEYIKRFEKDVKLNNVVFVLIETTDKYSKAQLREKVLDVENPKKGIFVLSEGDVYKYVFQAKKYNPLVLITKYTPQVKSTAEKPLSKFVVKKVLAGDFTFDDLISAIESVLKE
jgi:hypothetical protein